MIKNVKLTNTASDDWVVRRVIFIYVVAQTKGSTATCWATLAVSLGLCLSQEPASFTQMLCQAL